MLNTILNKVKLLWKDPDERKLLLNVFFAFVVKGLSLILSLFSMPLYIKYFHNETVLGLWYTVLSLLSWISICDLGLGNGLRNRLTEALAKNDAQKGKEYVSSTYFIVSVIILPIIIIANLGIRLADLNSFFNVPTAILGGDTLVISVSILVIGVGLSFVLKLINNVIYATQLASLNNALALISSVLPLLYILFVKGGDPERSLIQLSLVHVASINLPLIVVSVVLFNQEKLRDYRPSINACKFSTAQSMLGFGLQFFLAQLFFMFIMSTNETFITRLFSPDYVVEYTIYNRISTMIGSFFMLALTPMWSKITKDLAQKNYRKIKQTNRVLYCLAGAAIVAQFAAVPFLQLIVDIWLREDAIAINTDVAMIFAVFGGLYISNIVLTTVANGIGELKSQIVFYGIGTLLKIPMLMFLVSRSYQWHVVVVYNCVVLGAFCIYQIIWIEERLNKFIQMEE